MKKWMKIALSIGIALLIIVGLSLPLLNSGTTLNEISAEELLEDVEEGFVYIGRPTCESCQVFQPRLEEVADQENTEVYYVDGDELTEEEQNELMTEYYVTSVPYFFKLEHNQVSRVFLNDAELDEELTKENLQAFLVD